MIVIVVFIIFSNDLWIKLRLKSDDEHKDENANNMKLDPNGLIPTIDLKEEQVTEHFTSVEMLPVEFETNFVSDYDQSNLERLDEASESIDTEKCPFCKRSIKQKGLKRHIDTLHNKTNLYYCLCCREKPFNRSDGFKVHQAVCLPHLESHADLTKIVAEEKAKNAEALKKAAKTAQEQRQAEQAEAAAKHAAKAAEAAVAALEKRKKEKKMRREKRVATAKQSRKKK